MSGNFIWYELMTPDPAGAAAFYGALAGWAIQPHGNAMPNGSEYRMIGRSDGGNAGGVLTLTPGMTDMGMQPVWIGYIHAPDLDAAVARLQAAGGTVHMPVTDMGVGRMAMVSDPWGATFYLMDPRPPEGQPDAVSDVFADKPQHMRWNQHWSPDARAAAAFYADLVGWRQDGGMTMPDGRDYLFVHAGEVAVGAVGTMLPEGRGARWEFILGVDDIDLAVAAVTANGGTVDGQPGQVPGGDWSASIIDPQGARIGIVGPRKGTVT
jgi:predicted enzyme related to lactoylglutathione lyase